MKQWLFWDTITAIQRLYSANILSEYSCSFKWRYMRCDWKVVETARLWRRTNVNKETEIERTNVYVCTCGNYTTSYICSKLITKSTNEIKQKLVTLFTQDEPDKPKTIFTMPLLHSDGKWIFLFFICVPQYFWNDTPQNVNSAILICNTFFLSRHTYALSFSKTVFCQ